MGSCVRRAHFGAALIAESAPRTRESCFALWAFSRHAKNGHSQVPSTAVDANLLSNLNQPAPFPEKRTAQSRRSPSRRRIRRRSSSAQSEQPHERLMSRNHRHDEPSCCRFEGQPAQHCRGAKAPVEGRAMKLLVMPRDQIGAANTRLERPIDHIRDEFSSCQCKQDSTAGEWVYECPRIANRNNSLHLPLPAVADGPRAEPRIGDDGMSQSTSSNWIAEHSEFE